MITRILEIIHTDIDICGSFSTPCLNGQRYFILLINDHSRYMYLYFLNHKEKAFDGFKIYKAKVERRKDRKIKIVRSYRGGE